MDNSDTDNLYPNAGIRPYQPLAKATKKKQESLDDHKVLTDLLKRFEDRIAFYSSIDAISAETITKPDEFMHLVAANKIAKANLEAEFEYLKGVIDDMK